MLWSPHPKGECARCGFKYDLHKMRKEWTNNRVCPDCFDKKPEDLKPVRPRPEGLVYPNAAPETQPVFITPGVNDVQESDL